MWLLIRWQKLSLNFCGQGYISIFRALAKLLSDWGANFESSIISKLCECMNIWKVRTLKYHHQTNGQVERAHQMLMQMIGNDWIKIRRQTGLSIYQNWCMLTTPQDQPSPDIAHTTWSLVNDHAYQPTFIFPLFWAQENTSVFDHYIADFMWATVQSLQGSTSTVYIRGWKAEVILWS